MRNDRLKMPSSASAKDSPFSQREKEMREAESKIKRDTLSLWERVRVFRVWGEGINLPLTLILLSCLLFFFKLGSFSLYDAAETTYGEFTKNILKTGNWITMYYNGEIIFDKPPLYFWLAALLSKLIGFNEWAIRFWAALAGVLIVLTTYAFGKKFYNERTGFFSGIIVMTAFQFLVQSRIAELDIVLTLFLFLSLFLFLAGYQSNDKQYFILMYIPMALGMLIKGLLSIALPAFAIFLFLLIKKELPKLKEILLIPGILIIALIGLPWYIAEYLIHGKVFVDFALGFLFLSRFQGAVSGHVGPWYYYFIALLLGFAPWSHFIPLGLWQTFKNRKNDPELFSLCFILPTFVVFSIAQTKIPNYILPLYPFLAIMVGKLWDEILQEPENKFSAPNPGTAPCLPAGRNLFAGFAISNFFFAVVIILIIIGFILVGTSNYSSHYREMMPNLIMLATVLAAGSVISIAAGFLKQYWISFTAIPVMVFVIAFVLTTQTLPIVEKYKGAKELGQKVSQAIKENELIAAYNIGNRPGIVFYNVKPIVFLKDEKELEDFLRGKKGYCFILDKRGKLAVLH